MYTPYANYSVNPADPFTYQDLQQLRERQAKDMCHYTVKFFECDHKTDDNVKGCSLWNKTGTHCDIDNPAVRKREDCSIRSENVTGLCPRCQSRERARFLREKEEERERIEREREEELIQRDLEKARLADQEEARRSAEAHEAHIRQVQEESEASWRIEHESKKAAELQSTTTRTTTTRSRTTTVRDPSPPPPPPPPPPSQPRVSAPAFPPIDFSQPPKNQDYGHHFIGGRRQPIHPSQKLAAEHPLSPAAPVNPHVRRPQPTVRLAGGVTSPVRSPTASISGFAGSSTSTQRGPARPPPGSTSQEEPVNELQAMWNRKGIKRETDEDEEEDGIATESISPSESASQIDSGRRRGWRK
ncbi:hypothetical protein BU23DRAFT_138398 [Bimuria novae-zelandiae CBS 107.79]|uniref:Uncharacterized protein n=1 Tax=Bimuria novae-zelandiae CBS 107.79 TaxID=1447943 RepID=A0A6A5V997_9PLEO|nr:hypothetical protein BU23DRAFT_138398 [Bimuria novae-zelandiae CBS 107.79]